MKRVTRRPRPAQGDGTDRGSPLADSDEAVQVDASANRRRVPGARRGHLDLVLRATAQAMRCEHHLSRLRSWCIQIDRLRHSIHRHRGDAAIRTPGRDPRHIGVGFTRSYDKTGVRSHELIPQDISGRSTPSAAKSFPGTAL